MAKELKVKVLVKFIDERLAIMTQWQLMKLLKGKNKYLVFNWDFKAVDRYKLNQI